MEYKSLDFDADRPAQYSWLREEMAKIFAAENEMLFGPVNVYSPDPEVAVTELSGDEKKEYTRRVKVDNENIKKGYSRIKEKVKEIRQSFSKAIASGSRRGSAGTEPLSFGVDGDLLSSDRQYQYADIDDYNSDTSFPNATHHKEDGCDDECVFQPDDQTYDTENPAKDSQESACVGVKRKRESQVPKLIDNKRKHLQKNLSATQRDQLLLNEAREDIQFRKDLAEAMHESTDSFSKALDGVSQSMLQIGSGLCRSLEVMAQAMMNPSPPINQNLFYQNQHESAYRNQYGRWNLYNHLNSDHLPSFPPNYGGSGIPHAYQGNPSAQENPGNNDAERSHNTL